MQVQRAAVHAEQHAGMRHHGQRREGERATLTFARRAMPQQRPRQQSGGEQVIGDGEQGGDGQHGEQVWHSRGSARRSRLPEWRSASAIISILSPIVEMPACSNP
jgi:hypothetical protein